MWATHNLADGWALSWWLRCWAELSIPGPAWSRWWPWSFPCPMWDGAPAAPFRKPLALAEPDTPSLKHADSLLQISVGRCYLTPMPSFYPFACLKKCIRVRLVWYSKLLSSLFCNSKPLKPCHVTPWCGKKKAFVPKNFKCLQTGVFNLIVYNQSTDSFFYICMYFL